jgi:phosphohistidine phosphatase
MRRLLLLRHSKAVPAGPGEPDFDRALAPRGRRGARRIGQYLARERQAPELILCSAARRTRETLAEVLVSLAQDAEIALERQLYMASAAQLLARLRAVRSKVRAVMVVGHNPGIERLAAMLTGGGDARLIAALRAKFPTSGLAILEFPERPSWSRLGPATGRLVAFEVPPRRNN